MHSLRVAYLSTIVGEHMFLPPTSPLILEIQENKKISLKFPLPEASKVVLTTYH